MAILNKERLAYTLDSIYNYIQRFALKAKTVFSVNGIEPVGGEVTLDEVPYAQNLTSDDAQVVRGAFVNRASGGGTPVADGDAWLVNILGNRVYTVAPVAEELEMEVTPVERESPITAAIDRNTFVGYVADSAEITLTYTSAWSANPASYGITITGTPVSGDVITVHYVKGDRGVIAQSNPSTFVSTGWNLFDLANNRARVLRYSEQYGFKIGGAYSAVGFVENLTDTPIPVTVVGGNFTVPADGWVLITGGNATTYVYMTQSDWTDEYGGDLEAYRESVVDLSGVMVNFPHGLMQAGSIRDEINLNTQIATSNVERLDYNPYNLAIAEQSGREYETDRNYIYIAKAQAQTFSFSLDGAYKVSDHGIEFFTGTTVAVEAEMLYGQNLKDKLRTDVVTISPETLSETQKTQVRANIGAAKDSIIDSLFIQRTFTASYSLSSSSGKLFSETDLNYTIPEGYRPFCIAWKNTGKNTVVVSGDRLYYTTASIQVRVANTSSTTEGGTLTVCVLFIRDVGALDYES